MGFGTDFGLVVFGAPRLRVLRDDRPVGQRIGHLQGTGRENGGRRFLDHARRERVRVLFITENIETFRGQVGHALILPFLQDRRVDPLEDLRQRHFDQPLIARIQGRERPGRRLTHDAGERHFHRAGRQELNNSRNRKRDHRLGWRQFDDELLNLLGEFRHDRCELQRGGFHAGDGGNCFTSARHWRSANCCDRNAGHRQLGSGRFAEVVTNGAKVTEHAAWD
jgi:hypothetical protein